MQWILRRHCIEHVLVFLNEHHIKIDNKPELIQYPIPTITCKLAGIQTKIGMDIATDSSYIGFVKFILKKGEFETFNFGVLKPFKFEIYGDHYCKESVDLKDLKDIRNYAISPRENFVYIKIKIATLEQVNNIVDNFSAVPQKRFSMTSYTCDCGHQISVETYNGQCPICGKDSINKRKFESRCPVCDHTTLVDQYGNGECENCRWLIDKMSTQYRGKVIYPNLISLNKAKRLYKEGKPFRPDLNDFLNGLYIYSEMEFWYKGLNCCLFITDNPQGKIEFGWSPENVYYFSGKEDFIQNAKIGDEYVRDIWDKVENPKYI